MAKYRLSQFVLPLAVLTCLAIIGCQAGNKPQAATSTQPAFVSLADGPELMLPGFSEGLGRIIVGGAFGQRGYIDLNGKVVIRPQFQRAWAFADARARVRIRGRYGYINKAGKVVIPARYVEAQSFSEGLAAVRVEGRWGFINPCGEMVIPPRFDGQWGGFSEGRAAVNVGDKCGYIDRSGQYVVEPTYAGAGAFSQGRAVVVSESGWGYIDRNGKVAIPLRLNCAFTFSSDPELALVASKSSIPFVSPKHYFIDRQGQVAIPASVGELGYPWHLFREGLLVNPAVPEREIRFGYRDASGKWAIRPQFIKAESFSEGLAAVMVKRNKWGYIDRSGAVAIPARFEVALPFRQGRARVFAEGREGYIDRAGKYVYRQPKPEEPNPKAVAGAEPKGAVGRADNSCLPAGRRNVSGRASRGCGLSGPARGAGALN